MSARRTNDGRASSLRAFSPPHPALFSPFFFCRTRCNHTLNPRVYARVRARFARVPKTRLDRYSRKSRESVPSSRDASWRLARARATMEGPNGRNPSSRRPRGARATVRRARPSTRRLRARRRRCASRIRSTAGTCVCRRCERRSRARSERRGADSRWSDRRGRRRGRTREGLSLIHI